MPAILSRRHTCWVLDPMRTIASLGIVFITVVMHSVLQCGYVWAGQAPPDNFAQLGSLAFALACVLWAVADAQKRRKTPCFDFGFLVAVFFPISLIWYALWSRGVRGFLLLAALLGLMFIPWLSAIVVFVLRHGLA
jgi:Cobalt uptake substrate-specific transmembrane region